MAASQAAPRALLIRYLRSIVTCEVIEIDQRRLAEPGAICNVDLGVVDLDSTGAAGYELYARLARAQRSGVGAGAGGGAARTRSDARGVARASTRR